MELVESSRTKRIRRKKEKEKGAGFGKMVPAAMLTNSGWKEGRSGGNSQCKIAWT